MDLKKLKNSKLNARVIEIAKREKELLAEAILHIAEVQRRNMYLEYDCSSMMDYLTNEAGFSNGSAYRLLDAARLQLQVPDLADRIERGVLNMSQVRLVQEASRQSEKEKGSQSPAEVAAQKKKVLEAIQGCSVNESEKMVAECFDLSLKKLMGIRRQKDGSVFVEMTFTAEQWAEIKRAKLALSNALPSGNTADVIVHLAEKENRLRAKVANPRPTTLTLTPAKKKSILQRDQCCQFRHDSNAETCGSTYGLQVDHIRPRWAGGSDHVENLQILCGVHNRMKYRKEAGIRLC